MYPLKMINFPEMDSESDLRWGNSFAFLEFHNWLTIIKLHSIYNVNGRKLWFCIALIWSLNFTTQYLLFVGDFYFGAVVYICL